MSINNESLKSALRKSLETGKYEPVDDDLSARIYGNDAVVIRNWTMEVVARHTGGSIEFAASELIAQVQAEDDDFNLAGIHTFDDLLRHLQRGNRFCELITYRDGTKQLDTVLRADDHYIYWHNYGSSAHRATPRDMEFIVTKIFRMSLPKFLRRYVWA